MVDPLTVKERLVGSCVDFQKKVTRNGKQQWAFRYKGDWGPATKLKTSTFYRHSETPRSVSNVWFIFLVKAGLIFVFPLGWFPQPAKYHENLNGHPENHQISQEIAGLLP